MTTSTMDRFTLEFLVRGALLDIRQHLQLAHEAAQAGDSESAVIFSTTAQAISADNLRSLDISVLEGSEELPVILEFAEMTQAEVNKMPWVPVLLENGKTGYHRIGGFSSNPFLRAIAQVGEQPMAMAA